MTRGTGGVFARALPLLAFCGAAHAATPVVDIPTPYLPSTAVAVEEMLRLAEVNAKDVVYDLGSGDGRIVIAAAKYFGARGVGIEIDAKLVAESIENARQAGVADRVSFHAQDVLKADIAPATVVTLYLLPPLVQKLKPRLLNELRPGTRIVAHDFGIDGWQADRTVAISKTYFLYVVPAAVAGRWRLWALFADGERSYDFQLKQEIQRITGGSVVPSGYLPFFEARLAGDRISFALVEDGRSHRFEGRVRGNAMEGIMRSGIGNAQTERAWRAERLFGSEEQG